MQTRAVPCREIEACRLTLGLDRLRCFRSAVAAAVFRTYVNPTAMRVLANQPSLMQAPLPRPRTTGTLPRAIRARGVSVLASGLLSGMLARIEEMRNTEIMSFNLKD
ncbi:hypothetical protein KTD55_12600 [Burkholderia gladioli]|nr:hypothetical protein [Burkholderia gladioli]